MISGCMTITVPNRIGASFKRPSWCSAVIVDANRADPQRSTTGGAPVLCLPYKCMSWRPSNIAPGLIRRQDLPAHFPALTDPAGATGVIRPTLTPS